MPGFVSAALVVTSARPAEGADAPEAGADAPLIAVTRGIPLSTALAAVRAFADAPLVRAVLARRTQRRRSAAGSRVLRSRTVGLRRALCSAAACAAGPASAARTGAVRIAARRMTRGFPHRAAGHTGQCGRASSRQRCARPRGEGAGAGGDRAAAVRGVQSVWRAARAPGAPSRAASSQRAPF